ncbi:hypothetical protein AMS68_002020 [Peltaster fructicola]|uniref:SGNH hydrolase-type esterase domain-containing protein n=1 Tax=Peltaster fructicola TaxID=286661 RepID=A0A6H0XP60_9PEZI|nr:hypothetical protein AMS68_002020 [Peltaster fructicola]
MLSLQGISIFIAIVAAQSPNYCSSVEFLYRPSYSSYIALGDSYAAGLGSFERLRVCNSTESQASSICTSIANYIGIGCDKDEGSYAFQFASKHVTTGGFSYPACSGATTADVTKDQLVFVQSQELVTLQVGGDDNSAFSTVLKYCLVDAPQCADFINQTRANLTDVINNRIDGIMAAITTKVPATTTKVLVGYLQFFGQNVNCTIDIGPLSPGGEDVKLSPSLSNRMLVNGLVADANQRLKLAAVNRGFVYADGDAGFAGHRWCDVELPWFFIPTYNISGTDTDNKNYTELAIGHPTYDGQ